jgi:hypothetical protein
MPLKPAYDASLAELASLSSEQLMRAIEIVGNMIPF